MRVVDISALKQAVNLLLDHVIGQGVESLPLEEQFYWKVLDDEKYLMGKRPDNMGVGDLFADLDFVEQVLSAKDQPVALLLTEIAPILAYVGEVAGQKLASSGG
jgi:hypothetical protein